MAEAKRVIVTGATGLIGNRLCRELLNQGYTLVVFSRHPEGAQAHIPGAAAYVAWQPEEHGPWMEQIEGAYGVVNLAGGSIYTFGKRQTRESVSAETQSRIRGIHGLVNAMAQVQSKPKVFVCASAVGTYGFDGFTDMEFNEASKPGEDFWGQTSLAWEEAALAAEEPGVRTVLMRFGYVLDMQPGSGLARQAEQFRRGFGGPVRPGKQWQPWIHNADAVGLIMFALEDERVRGPLNGTAPDVVRNRDFARTLAQVVGKPARFGTPGWVLKMWLGVTAETILYGRRVLPKKALKLGYPFQFPTLESALRNLVAAEPLERR
ncbi:MAG TPA: TIGR01777 family oxidoreductase [Ktedonobacterales bacterium]|nr:TIGR01777 family oxidoreductase [Ktedonobacterales bacterium]